MSENSTDKVAMLLSTDWFFPYWSVLGFASDESARQGLRDACRQIFKDIMGQAKEYWHVSFTEQRLEKTSRDFVNATRESGIVASDIELLASLALQARARTQRDSSLLLMVLDLLLEERVETVVLVAGPELCGLLKQIRRNGMPATFFQELSEMSTTPWDQFIRSVTPDLPECVPDFLSEEILPEDEFLQLWAVASKATSPQALSAFASLLKSTAFELAEIEVELPNLPK